MTTPVDLSGLDVSDVRVDLYVGEDNLPVREHDSLTISDTGASLQMATIEATVDYEFGMPLHLDAPPAAQVHPLPTS